MNLAERFWSLARAMEHKGGDRNDPVSIVRHVLRILDALDRGEQGDVVSVATVSFLKLLRQSEINGDLSYASPEQIRGEMVDERSLVFSVGVLLFERLTGRHPFGAEASGRRLSRISKVEFGSGVNYFPNVPGGLRHVLMRAMGPFPEERWASLRELRARLEQFITQESPAPYLPGASSSRAVTHTADDEPTRVVDMQRVILDRAAKNRANTDPTAVAGSVTTTAPVSRDEGATKTAKVITASSLAAEAPAGEGPRIYIKPKAKLTPLVWAGAGAAIASVAFFMLQKGPSSSTSAAQQAAQPGESSRATPVVAAKPVATTTAAPARKLTGTPPEPPATKANRSGLVTLDARQDTDRLGELLSSCFSKQRKLASVRVGISLLYGSKDGRVKAIYYAGKGSVDGAEKQCIDSALGRVKAEPSPKGIVGYNMLFHADGSTIKLL